MTADTPAFEIVNTRPEHFHGVVALCRRVYPASRPWTGEELASHVAVFPVGQFVACDRHSGEVIGMAASLIVHWEDYDIHESWRDFTDDGLFTNHDPVAGHTLYGAEVMADPDRRRQGIGRALYGARRSLVERLGLHRIRAGSRLRGYRVHADRLSARDYVRAVVQGELKDPTLSFQLAQGFHVLDVVRGYLRDDPDSLGYAAVIEWINVAAARPGDYGQGDPYFQVSPVDGHGRADQPGASA